MRFGSRRGGLVLLLAAGCSSATSRMSERSERASAPLIVVSASELREQTADQQVQQALNRLGYGPRPGDLARVRATGVDRWIALQLAPDRIDDGATDALVASYDALRRTTRDLVREFLENQQAVRQAQMQLAPRDDTAATGGLQSGILRDDPQLRQRIRQSRQVIGKVQSARLARAVATERQLQEVMTDFWENHFNVYAGKGMTRLFIPAYDREVIRPLALGRFRDLLGAVAKSPAMLFYLDQWQSAADSLHPTLGWVRGQRRRVVAGVRAAQGLNENFARELLELHTLGVDGGYTQRDVMEVARALTGWTMAPRQDAEFVFRPELHDAGEKMVLGHRLPAGRGIEDGEEVLDILARDPHTAQFIARKLAVRFVSDAPPQALVDRAAQTYTRTDGDAREVVRTIVTSPEFFSRAAYHAKVKSPFELVASALRAVGARPDTSMRSAQAVAFLGEPIFGHQAPDGWPETGESWMNAGAILNRINFGLALAGGRLPGAGVAQWSDRDRLRSMACGAQVDAVIAAFLGGQASPDTRQILLDGENPLASDATARASAFRPAQLDRLAQLVGLAIGAPEFQRR
jgi:uncharacterized protein (DUF1800 family)